MLALTLLVFAAAFQADPDLAPAAVNREIERFQRAYLREKSLEPARDEMAAIAARFDSVSQPAKEKSAREREIGVRFMTALVANFKFQRDLHRKHGGRVALSAFGFHVATDALIAEWQAWESSGRWRFASAGMRQAVFEYLRTMRGDGVVEGARAEEVFAHPIWDPPVK